MERGRGIFTGEVDARRGGERSKETTRSAVVDVLERAPVEKGGEEEGGGTCGATEGWFGKAMNISPAHLFMQYFALAALRRLPLSLSFFLFLSFSLLHTHNRRRHRRSGYPRVALG